VTLFTKAYEKFAPITGYAGPFIVSGVVEELYGTYSVNADHLQLLDPEEMEKLSLQAGAPAVPDASAPPCDWE